MAKAGIIEIDLAANTARFQSDMKKATAALNTNAAQMKKSLGGVENSFKSLNNGLGLVTKAFAALWAAQGVGAVLKMSDNFNTLEGRIKNATRQTGDFNSVQSQLSAISKETGSIMGENVATFQRLQIGARELGKSNAQVLNLVKTVNQLGVIGGASGEAMKNGLTQFSQAMSAGIVRAEEFNSLVENTPAIVERIAKGMGKTQGQLRQMVLDGKLLSKDVFEALSKQSADIQKEFDQMPKSLAMAMNNLNTVFTETASAIDQAFGVTQGLAGATNQLAESLQGLKEFTTVNRDLLAFNAGVIGGTASVVALSQALIVVPGQLNMIKNATIAFATTIGMGSGGLGAVLLAVAGIAGGVFVQSMIQHKDAVDRASRSILDIKSELEGVARQSLSTSKEFYDLGGEYDHLSKKTKLSTDETTRMRDITQTLASKLPMLNQPIDTLIQKYGSLANAARAAAIQQAALVTGKAIDDQMATVKKSQDQIYGGFSFSRGPRGEKLLNKVEQQQVDNLKQQMKALIDRRENLANELKKGFDKVFNPAKSNVVPISAASSSKGSKGHSGKSEAEKEMDRLKQSAQELHDRNKTTWESYKEGIASADKLLKLHRISLEDYQREVERLNQTVSLKMPDLPKLEYDNTDSANKISNLIQGKFNNSFEDGKQLTESLRTAQEKLGDALKTNQQLFSDGSISLETLNRANLSAQLQFDETTKSGQSFAAAIGNITAEFGDKFFDTVTSSFQGAKVSMRDFVSSALMDLSKLIFKLTVTIPLAKALTNMLGGGSGGNSAGSTAVTAGGSILGAIAKSFFSGKGFADGGSPPVGKASMVGERGPELFVPKTSGTIIPNHQLGGGGGPIINIKQDIHLSTGVQQTVRAELISMMPQIEKKTTAAVKTAINRGGSMSAAVGRKN